MTKRTTISLIWVVIVSLLLGGAFLADTAQLVRPRELGVELARPAEPGRDRVRFGRDVVSVQRIADLEAERVARAEPAGYGAPCQHGVPERGGVLGGAGELDAELSRVARSADEDLDTVDLTHGVREGRRLGEPEALQRARSLNCDEPVLVGGVAHLAASRLALLQPLVVGLAVGRVDHEQELTVREAVDDEVVDDPAALVRQERVLRLPVADAVDVVREHLLQEGLGGRSLKKSIAVA